MRHAWLHRVSIVVGIGFVLFFFVLAQFYAFGVMVSTPSLSCTCNIPRVIRNFTQGERTNLLVFFHKHKGGSGDYAKSPQPCQNTRMQHLHLQGQVQKQHTEGLRLQQCTTTSSSISSFVIPLCAHSLFPFCPPPQGDWSLNNLDG